MSVKQKRVSCDPQNSISDRFINKGENLNLVYEVASSVRFGHEVAPLEH
jgi:hypothetical protein